MTISRPTGQDPQSKLLWDILNQLYKLEKVLYTSFSTAASTWDVVTITGDDVNTDYAMPANCDVTGKFIINNNFLDASLLLVGGVPTIRFTDVLTIEQFPAILYTTL